MLTQNRVIKVETCSIHICFGCKYKYAVQVYLLACLVDLDGPAVLLWVKLSFFASKLVALRTFNQSHSCRIFCEAYILSHIGLILAIVEPDCTFDHCCVTQLERVTWR